VLSSFKFKPDTMIGDQAGGDIRSTIKVCTNGVAYDKYLTTSDVTKWTTTSADIYSDHAPIRYEYTIDDKTGIVTCGTGGTGPSATTGTRSIRFVTWNIAYRMQYISSKGGGGYYLSKFYCSETLSKKCEERDDIYGQRLTNILTAVDTMMTRDNVDYVLLQECEKWYTTSPNAIQNIANGITGFMEKYDVLNFSYNDKPPVPSAPPATSSDSIDNLLEPTSSIGGELLHGIKDYYIIVSETQDNPSVIMLLGEVHGRQSCGKSDYITAYERFLDYNETHDKISIDICMEVGNYNVLLEAYEYPTFMNELRVKFQNCIEYFQPDTSKCKYKNARFHWANPIDNTGMLWIKESDDFPGPGSVEPEWKQKFPGIAKKIQSETDLLKIIFENPFILKQGERCSIDNWKNFITDQFNYLYTNEWVKENWFVTSSIDKDNMWWKHGIFDTFRFAVDVYTFLRIFREKSKQDKKWSGANRFENIIYHAGAWHINNFKIMLTNYSKMKYKVIRESHATSDATADACTNVDFTDFLNIVKYKKEKKSLSTLPLAPPPQVKKNTEFCLIVKKPTPTTPSDIQVFNFIPDVSTKTYPTPMSQYVSKKFSSYLATFQASNPYPKLDFFDRDIISVMCYVIPPTKTIFFNVHFNFGNPIIWQRQKEIYDFMNAIVDIIRSIPPSETQLYLYHNYDIVFSGDFNVNMLQRFPKDIKYPDGRPMEPYFFKSSTNPDQKTIISTTKDNSPSARATNGDKNNYNTTNIDFSILYPALVESVSTSSPLPAPAPGPSPSPSPIPSPGPAPSPAPSLPLTLKGVVQVREGNGDWNNLNSKEVTKIFAPIKKVIDGILENPQYKDYYIGLTYSANRLNQTSKIFEKYGFTGSKRPSSLSNMPFNFMDVPVGKILEVISGANQAEVIKLLYDTGKCELVTNKKYEKFRIIPFSTMEDGIVVPTSGELGDESDCIKFVDLFLKLPKTIIIGWTSSIGKHTITSNTDKQGPIYGFKDLVIAIGGGVTAGIPPLERMVTKYIDLLISKWDNPSQKFVNSILGIAPIVSAPAPAPVPVSASVSASVSTTASSSLSPAIASSVIPEYINTYNKLAITGKPVSNCACNHTICIQYNTLLANNLIRADGNGRPTTGVHSVIIFKSKKSPTTDDTKFWALLGKENVDVKIKKQDGSYYNSINLPMLNTIGGKLDHRVTSHGNVKCDFCIIENMIREINEEAKLSFPPSSISTHYQGNMNEQIFNSMFKKDPTRVDKTDYDDYYLLVRGGNNKIVSPGKYDLSYVFIGLFPYQFDEESLKKYIMDRNRFIEGVHYTTAPVDHSLKEMYYLNLVRWNYSLYDDPKNKSDNQSYYGSELPSDVQTYSPPDDSDYLLPYTQLKTLYQKPNSKSVVGNYGIFFTSKTQEYIRKKWGKPYFQDGKDYISFYAAGSLYYNTYHALKSLFDQVIDKGKTTELSSITDKPTSKPSIPSGVSQVRILSLDEVNTEISKPDNNSIYIINGGSFNPPHFGHIGLFEIAYQAIVSNPTITKTPGQKYYGVMVLAPKKHIRSKLPEHELNKNGVLTLNARVKLCQLTIADYQWKNSSKFGPQNMIVVNQEEYDPMVKIIGSNPSKIQNMYYLCGSDFYFDQKDSEGNVKHGHYAAHMNMIYSIRHSSLDATPDPYTGSFKRVRITDSEYQDMSSTKVRRNILTLEGKDGFNPSTAKEIIRNIGKGSYCYLGSMPYLILKSDYHLQEMGCLEAQGGGGSSNGIIGYTKKRHTLKNSKPKSRKIKKHAVRSISTTRFTKKKHHLKHNNNKKHKTRRNKH